MQPFLLHRKERERDQVFGTRRRRMTTRGMVACGFGTPKTQNRKSERERETQVVGLNFIIDQVDIIYNILHQTTSLVRESTPTLLPRIVANLTETDVSVLTSH